MGNHQAINADFLKELEKRKKLNAETAKEVASILTKNEATVRDMIQIFDMVQSYLIVKRPPRRGYSFANYVPTQLPNGDWVWDD